jgi:hypothetical protein
MSMRRSMLILSELREPKDLSSLLSLRHQPTYPLATESTEYTPLFAKNNLFPFMRFQEPILQPFCFQFHAGMGGTCRWSRRCSMAGAADGRLVVEATMRSLVVVVVDPGLEF